MPENPTTYPSDFESIKDTLVVVLIDGERCYGQVPNGFKLPDTDQAIEFDVVYNRNGEIIRKRIVAYPFVETSTDDTDYGIIGPDSTTIN